MTLTEVPDGTQMYPFDDPVDELTACLMEYERMIGRTIKTLEADGDPSVHHLLDRDAALRGLITAARKVVYAKYPQPEVVQD